MKKLVLGAGLKTLGGLNMSGKKALKDIYCYAPTAPTATAEEFGSSDANWVGRDTYSTGENKLYVPVGATGYDTGKWLDPLCAADKCGFTLSATL